MMTQPASWDDGRQPADGGPGPDGGARAEPEIYFNPDPGRYDETGDGIAWNQSQGDGYDQVADPPIPAPDSWPERPPVRQKRTRRQRRRAKVRNRANAREARWQQNRLAVPYRTDGPKITFGVLWFAIVIGAAFYSGFALSAAVAGVAGLAGLQAGFVWFPDAPAAKWWTALAALFGGLAGFAGVPGVGIGALLACAMLLLYSAAFPAQDRSFGELLDVLLRSAVPVAVAAASMGALYTFDLGAVLPLILLVSAYEIGDFLVGSGSANAVEGPISGMVSLGVVLVVLWVAAPAPFTDRSILLFGLLTAVCCPLGQILASALLPRGNAWAPALRRLDSYLLSAPLWLFLFQTAPDATML